MGNRKQTLSREEIRKMRGRYKLNTDGKPFSQWRAEHKREEIELEERKLQRLFVLGKKVDLWLGNIGIGRMRAKVWPSSSWRTVAAAEAVCA